VFWRQFLRWACLNVPVWLEPIAIAMWTLLFLLNTSVRRGVMLNLRSIVRGSSDFTNFFRTYVVFWNFAWTITETMRFKELRVIPDWEFDGYENFLSMVEREGGAIVLTAHMGSYDLGAHLFAATTNRRILMVRAPETDPDTQNFEASHHQTTTGDAFRIDFNTNSTDLAFELLDAARRGEIVAIQGDRVTPGISGVKTKLFGTPTELPAGPFALAMAARVPIYPLFVIRRGRRHYRVIARKPIILERRSRRRDDDMQVAVDAWAAELEAVIAESWNQWFAFEPFSSEVDK
jgi:lauroyl/myristoyl acyltransferase